MPAHPNRSKTSPARNPTPEEVKALRESALIYRSTRNWQQWEAVGGRMDPALWELFRRKAKPTEPGLLSRTLKLVTDIRHACGDNGKRMQDELVTFIGEQRKDADMLDFFASRIFDTKLKRQQFCTYMGLHPNDFEPDIRAAIAAAMEKPQ
jgi:hypothetical protein